MSREAHVRFCERLEGRFLRATRPVVERFFGSLKHEWLLKVNHLTRESMKMDVYKYIGYYNHDRLHTTLEDMAPVDYEKSNLKVSNLG